MMEEKITLNLFYVGLIAALVSIVATIMILHSGYVRQERAQLLAISETIGTQYERTGDPQTMTQYDNDQLGIQLTGPRGEILYQSAEMQAENAENMQVSRTLQDGSVLLLVSLSTGFFARLSGLSAYLLILGLVLVLLCFLAALLLSRRLVQPIRDLPRKMENSGYDPALDGEMYPELTPVLSELMHQRNERESVRQEFTANVSHELKTPLTTISGYSEMIANGLVAPDDIPRVAGKIHDESERMQALVGDIIELSALDSELPHTHEEQVPLLELVLECQDQLSPRFAARHLNVTVSGEGFRVLGDRRQLWELVYNLMDNAWRYNVDGGLISVSVQNGVLSVKDTGIGIPKDAQPRIFERFYRVDKSHSRATGGTGLGLSIVKHVAELHGAEIQLESTDHIGTEVRIIFPGNFT